MFSCFTKCCIKRKNSITNCPTKKISDDTLQNIRSEVECADSTRYNIISKARSHLDGLEIHKKTINNKSVQHISSV